MAGTVYGMDVPFGVTGIRRIVNLPAGATATIKEAPDEFAMAHVRTAKGSIEVWYLAAGEKEGDALLSILGWREITKGSYAFHRLCQWWLAPLRLFWWGLTPLRGVWEWFAEDIRRYQEELEERTNAHNRPLEVAYDLSTARLVEPRGQEGQE